MELEKLDRDDLLIWDTVVQKDRKKLGQNNFSRDIRKFNFPQSCIKVWNDLDKRVVEARIIIT